MHPVVISWNASRPALRFSAKHSSVSLFRTEITGKHGYVKLISISQFDSRSERHLFFLFSLPISDAAQKLACPRSVVSFAKDFLAFSPGVLFPPASVTRDQRDLLWQSETVALALVRRCNHHRAPTALVAQNRCLAVSRPRSPQNARAWKRRLCAITYRHLRRARQVNLS